MLIQLPIQQWEYIQSTSDSNWNFYMQPFLKLLSLLGALSDYLIKFATYHLHYKNKLVDNLTQTFICAANYLYFLCNLENLLATSLLTNNGGAYIVKPALVTKKRELPRTFLHHLFHLPLFLFLFFGLTLSNMRLAIFEYLAMSKMRNNV